MNITKLSGSTFETPETEGMATAELYKLAQAYEEKAVELASSAETAEAFAKATAMHKRADELMNIFYARDPENPRNDSPDSSSSGFMTVAALAVVGYLALK